MNLYAQALHNVAADKTINSRSVSCESPALWPYGSDLLDAIKKVDKIYYPYFLFNCHRPNWKGSELDSGLYIAKLTIRFKSLSQKYS